MKRPSPAEPVSELRRIPIIESGEPLVNFMERCPELIWDRPRFHYRREQLLRESAADMLCQANSRLPKGLRLAIIEGWRAPLIQRRMYLAIKRQMRERFPHLQSLALTRKVNQFSAPMNRRVPPPHTTGGAVDLMVAREDGSLLDHNSPLDWMDPAGFAMNARGISDEARRTRDILIAAMEGTGLTNYPSEYWHWSYGDQGWAYRGGHPHAIYGPVEPPGWTPAPEDLVDEPLRLVD